MATSRNAAFRTGLNHSNNNGTISMNDPNKSFSDESFASSSSNTNEASSSNNNIISNNNSSDVRNSGRTQTYAVPVLNNKDGVFIAKEENYSSSDFSDAGDNPLGNSRTDLYVDSDESVWIDSDDDDFDSLKDPVETEKRKALKRRWDYPIRKKAGLKPKFVYKEVEQPKVKKYDTKLKICRHRTWQLVDKPFSSVWAKLWSAFIMGLILFSTFTFILETVPRFYNEPAFEYWEIIEAVVVSIFTVEFLLRISTTPHYKKFFKNGMNWVDFLAILPFYIEVVAGSAPGLTVIRVIRLTRIFRIFKLGRYSSSFKLILKALSKSVEALVMLMLFIIMGMILTSSLIYFAEQSELEWDDDDEVWRYTEPHPDVGWSEGDETVFQSIPHSLWWSITTITTVGYGDMYPITPAGKAIAGITMVLGILIIALPITILGQKFNEAYTENQNDTLNDAFIAEHGKKEVRRRLHILAEYSKSVEREMQRFQRTYARLQRRYARVKNSLKLIQPTAHTADKIARVDIIPIDVDIN